MIVLGILFLLFVGTGVAIIQSTKVQTTLAKWAAGRLSAAWGVQVEVDLLAIEHLNKVSLEGFVVYDQQGDTLAYARTFHLKIDELKWWKNEYRIGAVTLIDADFRLKQTSAAGAMNIDFLTGDPSNVDEAVDANTGASIDFMTSEFHLRNAAFSYSNPYGEPIEKGLDFNNIHLEEMYADISNIQLIDDSLFLSIEALSLREKSGFHLHALYAQLALSPYSLELADLSLVAGETHINGDIIFEHEEWSDYQDFTSKIGINSTIQKSRLNFRQLGFFVPGLYGLNFPIELEGRFFGNVSNLKGRNMAVAVGERSVLRGNIDLIGLPNVESTFLDFRIKQLSSDYDDIAAIGNQLRDKTSILNSLPIEVQRLGSMYFEGSFTGFTKDFVAYGALTTEAGRLDLDLNLENDTLRNELIYSGGIEARNFDLGRILAISKLGRITAKADVDAISREKFISSRIDGLVEGFEYAGYVYKDIDVDGNISSNTFEGQLVSKDPNLDLTFDGIVDFSDKIPVIDFEADIRNLDLTALKLVQMEYPLSFSSTLSLNGQGEDLNTISGTMGAYKTFLCYGDSALYIEQIQFSAAGDQTGRILSLTSDIVDLGITGKFQPEELPAGFMQLVAEVLPSIQPRDISADVGQQIFDFSLNYKAANTISNLLFEGLEISPNTSLYGSMNNVDRSFGFFLKTDRVAYGDLAFENLSIDGGKQSEVIKAVAHTREFSYKGYAFQNMNFETQAYNDILDLGVGWLNDNNSGFGDLELSATFFDSTDYMVNMKSGYLGAYESVWRLAEPSEITFSGDSISIDKLAFEKNIQRLQLEGSIARNPESALKISLQNFQLASIDSLGIELKSNLGGVANINASVKDVYLNPSLRSSGTIDGLAIDSRLIGDVFLETAYSGDGKILEINGGLSREGTDLLGFEGDYLIGEERPLKGKLILDDFDMTLINAFNLVDIRDFSGLASGVVEVEGAIDDPELHGEIRFDEAKFTVDYLNTSFTFSDVLRVEDGWLGIDYMPLYDQEGNKGYVVASAFHENFENWTYDISADVENFLIMNTTREMNNLYYGRARATGTVQLGVFKNLLEIAVDAKTERGTSIKLPLGETGDVTLENFVHFIDRNAEAEIERTDNLLGVQLRLNVEATPEAEVQLIFDEQSGDIIRGRGEGLLTFEISPSGEFNMFGRYEITEGSYLFTLKNLINKQFTVRPGGVIGWYGDPYQADIDISASYGLRTPLQPIMIENPERYRAREDVNVVLNLTEKLMNPVIDFGIELPQMTELERSQLASVVSTTQQLNQQVFSLLILNRFLPIGVGSSDATSGFGGLGSATTSDFVSTQISNWLSEISNDFDIGVNYRPGDQISNQEVAVALSTQLFNERLLVSGNFGVTQASELQYSKGQSGLVGDFLLEYMLVEDGKIRLKVFNETNPYDTFDQSGSLYTQGVGLIYQEDFNTIDEFFTKVGQLFSNDEAKKAERAAVP